MLMVSSLTTLALKDLEDSFNSYFKVKIRRKKHHINLKKKYLINKNIQHLTKQRKMNKSKKHLIKLRRNLIQQMKIRINRIIELILLLLVKIQLKRCHHQKVNSNFKLNNALKILRIGKQSLII